MGYNNWRWEHAVGDWYKPLESVKGWKLCKECNEFPRVWIFDNGSHAKCCCGHKYDAAPARSESILSVLKRTGGIAEYSRDSLREAWNDFIVTGKPQNKLEEGKW